MKRALAVSAGALCVLVAAAPARTQDVPMIDTEDASLSSVQVAGARHIRPILTVDLRNGDHARGAYDDDRADLDRLPIHVTPAFVATLRPDLFLVVQSSNGFHAPGSSEPRSPRIWYESNNLLGLAWRPGAALTTALSYTIKTSPNGVSGTTHEANWSFRYEGDAGLAALHPHMAVTRRTRGGGGLYTLFGIAPERRLGARDGAASVTVPLALGIGWNDFYQAGSGTRLFGSGGVSLAQPLRLGNGAAALSLDLLALVRDTRLRRLDAPRGRASTIVPLATLALRTAW